MDPDDLKEYLSNNRNSVLQHNDGDIEPANARHIPISTEMAIGEKKRRHDRLKRSRQNQKQMANQFLTLSRPESYDDLPEFFNSVNLFYQLKRMNRYKEGNNVKVIVFEIGLFIKIIFREGRVYFTTVC